MARYKGRYGLSGGEVCTLYESCWRGKGLNNGCDFENFDVFSRWAAETGYVKYAHLRRIRTDKPYGPENAFWDFPDTGKQEYQDGHPCKDCDREDRCTTPCDIRLKYWDDSMKKIRENAEAHING